MQGCLLGLLGLLLYDRACSTPGKGCAVLLGLPLHERARSTPGSGGAVLLGLLLHEWAHSTPGRGRATHQARSSSAVMAAEWEQVLPMVRARAGCVAAQVPGRSQGSSWGHACRHASPSRLYNPEPAAFSAGWDQEGDGRGHWVENTFSGKRCPRTRTLSTAGFSDGWDQEGNGRGH